MQDRNGSIHVYSYDRLGRMTTDAVTTLASGVDGTVRRRETAYDTQGNAYLFTCYDTPVGGTALNQVQRQFNGLGQLICEFQEHSGLVNLASKKVEYLYSEMTNGVNHSRLTQMIYPDGYTLNHEYTGLDDRISRLSSQLETGGTVESFNYLGLGTVVTRNFGECPVRMDMIKLATEPDGDAGDAFTGLDRFGRVVDQRWLNSNDINIDRFQYGYDRNSNRVWKFDAINNQRSELYTYDALNQLTTFGRGELNTPRTGLVNTLTTQAWDYDAAGNWEVDPSNSGIVRNHDRQNRIISIIDGWTPLYDANGNTILDEKGYELTYDGWNKLVSVGQSALFWQISYQNDALNRRIREIGEDRVFDRYFSANWQLLQTYFNSEIESRYVWSPVYVDCLILRDQVRSGAMVVNQRLYALQDANFNVTATVDMDGQVIDRFAYSPFGVPEFLNESWGSGSNSTGWSILHQGGEYDFNTFYYQFRNRVYSPTLGRWLQVDPIGYRLGLSNAYRAYNNSPIVHVDYLGLITRQECEDIVFEVKNSEWYKSLVKQFTDKGCKLPPIDCEAPKSGAQGSFSPRDGIKLDYSELSKESVRINLHHELIHAYNYCYQIPGTKYASTACDELRAYYISGGCSSNGPFRKKGESESDCLLNQVAASMKSLLEKNSNILFSAKQYTCCIWDICLEHKRIPGNGFCNPKDKDRTKPDRPSACKDELAGTDCKSIIQDSAEDLKNWINSK